MRATPSGAVILILLSACSSGDGGGSTEIPAPPAPTPVQSPGGIWFGFDSRGEQASLYVSETGVLRAVLSLDGGPFASFGGGTVDVTADNAVSGSFELRRPFTLTLPPGEDPGCLLSGTLEARRSLAVDIVCSDSNGIVLDESITMIYDANTYERRSSLEAIAGNYTFEFLSDTNFLSIAGDGTLSGMIDNGARCMVNGTASIIDTDYTLIDITWTMSACTDLLGIYEGVVMSGFAMANLAPVGKPGSYYFLLTGRTENGVYAISVLYEPV